MRIDEGMPVRARDGACGRVCDLVVDPVGRRFTHLVVRPERSLTAKHLVPVGAVEEVTEEQVLLGWTRDQVAATTQVTQVDALDVAAWDPALREGWDVGEVRALVMPQLLTPTGLESGGLGVGPVREIYDRVPTGLAEVCEETPVRAAGGEVVGHVEGFVVGADFTVTHLVLQRGHRWRHRDVAIPVAAVRAFSGERVALRLDETSVGALPAVPFHRRRAR